MLKFIPTPDALFLHSRYSYDPTTGVLAPNRGWKAGKPITAKTPKGYIVVNIRGTIFLAHRIIYKMMTAQEPSEHIDHKNTKKDDNRWENIRDATNAENKWNQDVRSDSTSGLKGAYWCNRSQRWFSGTTTHGIRIWLGYFDTAEAAAAAYCAAAAIHHGVFAR